MRRRSKEVLVGNVGVGGDNPVRIQSMTITDTRDVEGTIEQVIRLVEAGCEIVRMTVQGKKEAAACEEIKQGLVKRGCHVPLVADIHFYPPAAMHVVDFVDKVRINPGNFVDKRAQFKVLEYDDESYQAELVRIEEKFAPLVQKCKRLGKAMRIGTNHGSLSDRIMNRYGDTAAGMVESALEFAHIARKYDYHDMIFSMKASNTLVMIEAYRLLVDKMDELGWDYPLHLGVTEAGEGEDGRVKSAIGIGSLLLDGIGDTIRVSLTEDPWHEIDPCKRLVDFASNYPINPLKTTPRPKRTPEVCTPSLTNYVIDETRWERILEDQPDKIFFAPKQRYLENSRRFFNWLQMHNIKTPVILQFAYPDTSPEDTIIHAAAEYGALLTAGLGDGICTRDTDLAYAILQGARRLQTKTEFISCPGCGRTLFNLQEVSARIRERTGHLPNVKIAIMGCIVNGPGEMADADFGYVGSRPGKIDLYVGKECVEKNIDMAEADDRLIDLIKTHGMWAEPVA